MSDEEGEEGEHDWTRMRRLVPWAYKAFDRIPRWREAMHLLFGEKTTYWEDDSWVDLTNKTMLALLQLEIEGIIRILDEDAQVREAVVTAIDMIRETSAEWDLVTIARMNLVFVNPTGQVVKVRADVARLIAEGKPLDVDAEPDGNSLILSRGRRTVAKIPLSLFLQLRSTPCWCHPRAAQGVSVS